MNKNKTTKKEVANKITKEIDRISVDMMKYKEHGDIDPLQVVKLDNHINGIAELLIEVMDQNKDIIK